jgi:hypothetical protein
MRKLKLVLSSFLVLTCLGCSDSGSSQQNTQPLTLKGEYIYRIHDECLFVPPPAEKCQPPAYPWDEGTVGTHPRITKDFFRCKGTYLNPERVVQQNNELARYSDCNGSDKHSLPTRENKEFIYPILIDLLNYLQAKTGKKIVITSGHRCPDHNLYVDPTPKNQYSKHMIGAEVSFYAQGLEEKPEYLIQLIQAYYKEHSLYAGLKEFQEFKRYEKPDVDVTTQPWLNKEIFIKLYKKNEGRNLDNRHPYPYISIQVRYDMETKEKVIYTWHKAHQNLLRY